MGKVEGVINLVIWIQLAAELDKSWATGDFRNGEELSAIC